MAEFLTFNRKQWSELRKSVPLTLTEQDLKPLLGFNENLSLDEVSTIFLPLVRLINYYIEENIKRQKVLNHFLDIKTKNMPYVIGIAGSVASGKSTTSRILQAILSEWPFKRKVDLITTDGFLYNLEKLKEKGILLKKGFPQSYDTRKILYFLRDIKSGKKNIKSPIYSQVDYDIIPNQFDIINQPDILIFEGLNVLQDNKVNSDKTHLTFISDYLDFSIYVDAKEDLLKTWFLDRFLKFRESAFKDPKSYFHNYTLLNQEEATDLANQIWDNINGLNLKENILPTRERANLILEKGKNHTIHKVKLRK